MKILHSEKPESRSIFYFVLLKSIINISNSQITNLKFNDDNLNV